MPPTPHPELSVFNGIPSSMPIMIIPSMYVTPILPFHSGVSFNIVEDQISVLALGV